MGKLKKDKTNKSKKNVSGTAFDLHVLEEMGGDKKDLELLGDFVDDEDEEEAIDYTDDLEAEPINKDDVRSYIQELGFNDIMEYTEEETGEEIPKTVKLLSRPLTDDEKKEEQMKKKVKKEEQIKQPVKEKKQKNKYKDLTKVQDGEVSSTTGVLDTGFIRSYTTRKHLLVKPGTKWYEHELNDDAVPTVVPTGHKVQELLSHVSRVHDDEVSIYKQQQESSRKSDVSWIRTVLSSGTLQDKMAAWTLRIQEAPVHNTGGLDHLVTMVNKKGRREGLLAMDTLKELFMSELLRDDRKLKTFDQHPLCEVEQLASGNKDMRDKRLILWYYEDQLKKKYAEFVHGLEMICHDNLREAKQKGLSVVFALLAGKPEQEKKLLSILTNKLGDPDYKVASNAAHLLTNLVSRHQNMKHVIVAEVERLMYRPNVAHKAQYYAVCFLNQVLLSAKESELALRLINIYFSFFKLFVKKGEVDGKMLSALLTGVNRAFPYCKGEQTKITEQMDTLYKVVHIVSFNTSVQALMLLYQVMDASESTCDRYYQALYRKLLDPDLVTSSKQSLFLNLIYKSMKKDAVDKRIKAFIKRLLQVCSCLPPPFVCGSLILLSEILKARPSLFQFVQMSLESDDDEEHFDDVLTDDEKDDLSSEEKQLKDTQNALGHTGHTTTSSWIHRTNVPGVSTAEFYDPQHRNPLYCRAESECVWELDKLTNHYHPTVALFSKNILQGEGITYSGDPLEDFTLIRFLDRFVYRNPKKRQREKKDGTKSHEHLQSRSRYQVAAGARGLAVNTVEYLQKDVGDIPVDEQFFHRYFMSQAKKKAALEEEDEEDEGSDVEDDDFDDFLDGYEKAIDGGCDFAGEFAKMKAEKKKKKKRGEDEESEEDDFDLGLPEDDLSGEEVDFEGDADLKAAFDDFDDGDLGDDRETAGTEVSGEEMDLDDSADFDEDFSDDGELDEEAVVFSDDEFSSKTNQKSSKRSRRSIDDDDDDDDEDDDDDDMFLDGPPQQRKKKKFDEYDPANLFAAAEEFADVMDDNVSSKVTDIGSEALSNKDNADAKQLSWEQNRDRWVQGRDWKTQKRAKQGGQHRGKPGGKPGPRGGKQMGAGGKNSRSSGGRQGDKGKSFGANKGGKKSSKSMGKGKKGRR